MARQDRDSQYGGGSYSSSSNRSTRSQSYGGGNDNRESYRTSTTYNKPISKTVLTKNKEDLEKAKIKKQMEDFANYTYQEPKFVPTIAGTIFSKLFGEKSFEVNKAYYTKNVIGKTNPITGQAYAGSIEDFQSYMRGRGMGTLDAMGRTIPQRSRRDDRRIVTQVQQAAVSQATTGPTAAEVSQSSATDAAQDTLLVKKRGRRQTILTDAQGLGSTATVAKKKLLG